MQSLFIIGNEKISCRKKNIYYSANVDFKSIVEGLSKYFDVNLFARGCVEKQSFIINHKKIILARNFFTYTINIIKSLKNIKKNKYLIISITPYTFIAFLILFFFSNEIYLYLRSNGFKEYEKILGKRLVFLYSLMYFLFLKKAKIITCEKSLVKNKNFYLVEPSELENFWFKNRKKVIFDYKINILYVGRVRVEKGIIDFIDIFNKLEKRFKLTIIGDRFHQSFRVRNINFFYFFSNINHLINQYDKSHILVLPSYTESHPKVVYESLSRLRPVIIFDDIRHIKKNTKGIFVCKRDPKNFMDQVNYVMKHYKFIQKQIINNRFPLRKIFIKKLYSILR